MFCGPDRKLTPVIAQAYSKLKESGELGFEIVFVSADLEEETFTAFFETMPWTAIPYEKVRNFKDALEIKCGVLRYPHLSVIEPNGTLVTNDAAALIQKHGVKAFPFSKEHLEALAFEERKEQEAFAFEDRKEVNAALKVLAAKHIPAMLGFTLIPKAVKYICFVLSEPNQDISVLAMSLLLPDIEAAHPGEFVVRYVPWTDEFSEDHKEAAGCLTTIPQGTLSTDTRRLVEVVAGPVRPPHLLVLQLSADGSLELLCTDAWKNFVTSGLQGYPWSDDAAETTRRSATAGLHYLKSESRTTLQRGVGPGATHEEVDAVAARSEVVGLYFAAGWCGYVRQFTPQLKALYEELRKTGRRLEVVLISFDQDQEDFDLSLASMPWLALPFSERQVAEKLTKLYGVTGYPSLVLLGGSNFEVLTLNGRAAVGVGAAGWPYDKATLEREALNTAVRQRQLQEAAMARKYRRSKEELAAVATQAAIAGPKAVLRRVRGGPGALELDLQEKTALLCDEDFITIAVPGCVVPPGSRAYYELEILARGPDSCVQAGWTTLALELTDQRTSQVDALLTKDARSHFLTPQPFPALSLPLP